MSVIEASEVHLVGSEVSDEPIGVDVRKMIVARLNVAFQKMGEVHPANLSLAPALVGRPNANVLGTITVSQRPR